jgi:hypothetical protein
VAPHEWASDAKAISQRLSGGASARISFAVECVNGLHYLSDIDGQLVPLDAATDVLGHNWQVVDMAHVRWAAGSAITALDLCAAALGRLYCGVSGEDARDLDLEGIKRREHRDVLRAAPGDPAEWAARVRGDRRYSDLLDLRHQLTHRVRPRHYKVELHEAVHVSDYTEIAPVTAEERKQAQDRRRAHMVAHAEAQAQAEAAARARDVTRRTRFALIGTDMPVPKILRLARDVATEHVERFLELPLTPQSAVNDTE